MVMDRLKGRLATHPVMGFVLLTFGISYLAGVPMLLVGMATIGPHSWLLHTYAPRILFVYGPALAALVLAGLSDTGGPVALLRRLMPARKDLGTAVGVVLVVAIAAAIALRMTGFTGGELSRTLHAHPGLLAAHFALQAIVVAIGEELGWRGWLLPHLAARMNRLRAALWTGVIWAAWHAPLLINGLSAAIALLASILGLSVLYTWLWSRARSGLFTVVVAHAAVNAPWFFWQQAGAGIQGGDERLPHAWLVFQTLCVAAALVLWVAKRRWWGARETVAAATSPSQVAP